MFLNFVVNNKSMRYIFLILLFISCHKEDVLPIKQPDPVVSVVNAYKHKAIVDTTITEYLATPIAGAKMIVPVVIIDVIPTDTTGVLLESVKTDLPSIDNKIVPDLDKNDVFNWTLNTNERVKFAIEEGSRFRAYNNPMAMPYVGIKVVKYFKVQTLQFVGNIPNYTALFDSIGLKKLVEVDGVKEVWFNYSLYKPNMMIPESNMSSPYGDVSNSYMHTDDLPVYNKTYVVYGHYYKGTYAEMIHARGHQIEAQMRNIDDNFFSNKFVGKLGENTEGRCGNTHFTPNSIRDYDYDNPREIQSDIADWNPNGGIKTIVKSTVWKKEIRNPKITINKTKSHVKWNLFIGNWVGGGDPHGAWLIYWFQSIPSDSKITFDNKSMENWWNLFYNWDNTKKNNIKLYN